MIGQEPATMSEPAKKTAESLESLDFSIGYFGGVRVDMGKVLASNAFQQQLQAARRAIGPVASRTGGRRLAAKAGSR
jgi:hypothetical protein